jgi:DNA-binding CsgD family transcriptional regulator
VATAAGIEVRHQLVGDAVREGLGDDARRLLHGRAAALLSEPADVARHLAAAGRGAEATDVALRALATAKDARDRAALLLIAAETSPPAEAMARRLEAARGLDEVADWLGVQRALDAIDPASVPPDVRVEAGALLAHAAFALGDIATCRAHLAGIEADRASGAVRPGAPADVRGAIESATFLVNAEGAVGPAIARLEAVAVSIPPGAAEAEDVAALRASILLLATGDGDVDRIRAAADGAFETGRYRTATDRARVVQYFLNMAVGCEAAREFLLDRHARYDAAGLGAMAHEFLADAAVAAMLGGRLHEAVTLADRLLEEPAPPRPRQMAGIYRARALALLGRIDEAEAALEALRPSATADFFGLGELLVGLAEAAFWGGRLDTARRWAEAALAVPAPLPVAQVHAYVQLAWARREAGGVGEPPAGLGHTPSTAGADPELRAIAAAAAGDHRAAARDFTVAAAAWARFHAPRSVHCRWAAADELARAGEPEGAIAGLRAALGEADAMAFEPLAARIRRSLRLLGVRVGRRPARGGDAQLGLTARERELIGLVERGLTNTEIARRLGLGRPTVARILGSAMGKLGVVTRAELAATGPR